MAVPTHVIRLIMLLAAGLVIGLAARWYFIPDSFYQYGSYRADSVRETAAQEPTFMTATYCQACHADRYAEWSASNHATVTCEACHGAAEDHPQVVARLSIPADTGRLCTLCHERMAERPAAQPQIDPTEHGFGQVGQDCTLCHNPHDPGLREAAVRGGRDFAAAGASAPLAAANRLQPVSCANPPRPGAVDANAERERASLLTALAAFGAVHHPATAGAGQDLGGARSLDPDAAGAARDCQPTTEAGTLR
jgi:hypothetical protein